MRNFSFVSAWASAAGLVVPSCPIAVASCAFAACTGSPEHEIAAARLRHNSFLTFINFSSFLCNLYSKTRINPIPILCFSQGIQGLFCAVLLLVGCKRESGWWKWGEGLVGGFARLRQYPNKGHKRKGNGAVEKGAGKMGNICWQHKNCQQFPSGGSFYVLSCRQAWYAPKSI